MRKLITNAIAFVLMTATSYSAVAQSRALCWRQTEIDAAKVRNMQTLLMVAALECRGGGIASDRIYNDFIAQNRGSLHGYNDSLREYYFRAYGEDEGRRAYDRFTTSLANRQSRSASDGSNFCRNAEMLGRLAMDSDSRGVLALASDLEERPYGVGSSCDEAVADETRALRDDTTLAAALPERRLADEDRRSAPLADADAPALAALPAERAPVPVPAVAMVPEAAPLAPARREDAEPMPLPVPVARAEPAPVAVAAPVPLAAVAIVPAPKAVAVAAVAPARYDPARALAAAAEALKLAAEALAHANDAPADAAPVIRERVSSAKKL